MNPIQKKPPEIRAGRFSFPLGAKTYIMGILNLTPDSFSDGGQFLEPGKAIDHVAAMLAQGADIIDLGGESTRPGGQPVADEEELSRVLPVLQRIVKTFDCPISIDTMKSSVARAALEAGACIVNDINGLQGDPQIAAWAFQHQAAVVIMHNARLYRTTEPGCPVSATLQADMEAFLARSCRLAQEAGLLPEQMIIDPGVGFGVTPEESIQMIARLQDLARFHLPILLGPSRKRFIGHILDLPADQRLNGTSAAVAIGIARGADIVRVHDVEAMAQVAKVADALCRRPLEGGTTLHG
jgi:dihydropteroate synthase